MPDKFKRGDKVQTPDGPASVTHTEGSGFISLDIPLEVQREIKDLYESGELTTGASMPRHLVKKIANSRRRMELDGMVEVELWEVVGPSGLRHFSPDNLTLIE